VGTLLDADQATVNRAQLWRVALRMFRQHPLTGVGPDGFRNLYGKYAGVTSWNKNIYTNNTYIEMFTNTGLLGGLAFVALIVLALVRLTRNIVTQPTGARWVLAAGVSAASVAFFLHGFADYFLFTTPIFVMFWLCLSISVLWPQMNRRERAGGQGPHGTALGG
jgi:O-antigen ligase